MGGLGDLFSNPTAIAATIANPTAMLGNALQFGSDFLQADFARKQQNDSNAMNYDLWFKNRDLQLDFAKNGLKWKIEDAARMGIHPLAALGAVSQSGSPISVGSTVIPQEHPLGKFMGEMGQNISRSITATQTPEQRAETELRLQLLRSQIGETDARKGYYDSMSAKNARDALGSGGMPNTMDEDTAVKTKRGQVQLKPTTQYTASKDEISRVSGNHPTWGKYYITPEHYLDLPYSDSENPFEYIEGLLPAALVGYKNFIYPTEKRVKDSWRGYKQDSKEYLYKTLGPHPKLMEGVIY